MKAVITPSHLHSTDISIPSSKSLSHRALICAALAEGESIIADLVENKDTEATIRCLRQLGASFERNGNVLHVKGTSRKTIYDGSVLDCNESGSTLRFLIPVFAALHEHARFTGHGRLMERPQDVYADLFHRQGLLFEKMDSVLKVQGLLKGGEYSIMGDVSSQFISGLLFALPLLKEDSVLHVSEPFESRSYVGLTMDALEKAGIVVKMNGNDLFIPGNQTYRPFETRIAGDESQAAFFGVLSAMTGTSLKVCNVAEHSHQGDRVYRDVLKQAGCASVWEDNGWKFLPDKLKAFTADLADCPDLGPVLFALAAQCEGTSVFTHCERLRIKESDRIACMQEELAKLGCAMESTGDTVTIQGKTAVRGGVMLNGHNDHRIVMALSVLACTADSPVMIEGAEAVNKSYPDFFRDLAGTGVLIAYDQ